MIAINLLCPRWYLAYLARNRSLARSLYYREAKTLLDWRTANGMVGIIAVPPRFEADIRKQRYQ